MRGSIKIHSVLWDSWRLFAIAGVWASIVVYLHEVESLELVDVPALPVSTVGVVVALYLGFKSTSAYNRWWEARKVWGQIINDSRSWANLVQNLPAAAGDEAIDANLPRRLVRRHLAWVNALAYQLRKTSRLKLSSRHHIFDFRLDDPSKLPIATATCFEQYVSAAEAAEVRDLANPAVHIVLRQGIELRDLHRQGQLPNNQLIEMMQVLNRLYDSQGMCERIKNTTFPLQFSYFGRIFTWIYIILLPLALLNSFEAASGENHLIVSTAVEYSITLVPFSMLISWLFYIVEKISDSCEDPFEGGTTDVPIAALTRTIEIDLLEMIGEPEIPKPLAPINGVLY